jgi:hypothetical protein
MGIYRGSTPINPSLGGGGMSEVYVGSTKVWPGGNTYDSVVASLNPIAYYLCDEQSGNLQPTIGDFELAPNESPTYGNDPLWGFNETTIACTTGNSCGFKSSGAAVPIPTQGPVSFSAMFESPSGNSYSQIICGVRQSTNNNAGFGMGVNKSSPTSNQRNDCFIGSNTLNVVGDGSIRDRVPVHMVCVIVQGSPPIWYTNNVEFFNFTNNLAPTVTNLEFVIGGATSGNIPVPMRGRMGRVAFYDYALSAQDAADLWFALPTNGGTP